MNRENLKRLIKNQKCYNCSLYRNKIGDGSEHCFLVTQREVALHSCSLPKARTCSKWQKIKWPKDVEMNLQSSLSHVVEEKLIRQAAKDMKNEQSNNKKLTPGPILR